MARIKVGIVGLGLVARSHLKGYLAHPRAEVVAVCDLSEEHARTFARQHHVPQVYTSYEEMLAKGGIDLVDIATPTFLHAPMALQAARAGKHIHCEKPFCRNVGEGQEVCAEVQRRGVKLLVGETYVFLAAHLKARELIEAGEIGKALQIRQRHGAWLERPGALVYSGPAERNWRIDSAKSGGGAYPWIFDHAVHFFATAEYLIPGGRIARIYSVPARQAQAPGQRGAAHDPYTAAEVDIPLITWTYEDPACQGVWMRAERLNGKYDYLRGFSTSVVGEKGLIEVLGEGGGNLFWEGRQQHLILHRQGQPAQCFRFEEGGDEIWDSEISYYSQGHINQVGHLLDSIVGDTQPRYSGEDGVHAVRCTLAAIRSAQEGRPVRVDEIGAAYTAYT